MVIEVVTQRGKCWNIFISVKELLTKIISVSHSCQEHQSEFFNMALSNTFVIFFFFITLTQAGNSLFSSKPVKANIEKWEENPN